MATLATSIGRGTLAARPATMPAGSLYFVTDTSTLYRSNGTTWDSVEASTAAAYTAENARDDIAAALVAGTGIAVTPNDAGDTITITATGGVAPAAHTHPASEVTDFAEAVDDRVGALLVEGSGIDLTYNDAAGSLTIAAATGAGPVPGMLPGLRAGLWYGYFNAIVGGTPTTAALTANRLYALPLVLPQAASIDRIGINVSTLIAATTIRLGIYERAADGTPGALRLDAGTVDSSTTGQKEITIAEALGAGWWWLAAISNGGPSAPTMPSLTGPDLFGQTNQGGTAKAAVWQVTNAAYHTALPNPFPVGSATGAGVGPHAVVRIA